MGYIIAGIIGYLIGRSSCSTSTQSELSGIGIGGKPRYGYPKTEEERLATHRARFGTSELPPRGTGLSRL